MSACSYPASWSMTRLSIRPCCDSDQAISSRPGKARRTSVYSSRVQTFGGGSGSAASSVSITQAPAAAFQAAQFPQQGRVIEQADGAGVQQGQELQVELGLVRALGIRDAVRPEV